MNTRHSFQAGHAPDDRRPRFSHELRGSPGSFGDDDRETIRLNRPSDSLPAGRPGLRALMEVWDRLAGPIAEDRLRDGLRGLRIDRHALWNCVRFEDQGPQWTRIHLRGHFEVLAACWRSGHRGPIQDHGGSICGVLVVEGAATEIGFMATPSGLLAPSRSQRVEAGAVVVHRPREVHQTANLESAATELISLHVFSPPLTECRRRRLAETTFAGLDGLVEDGSAVASAPL